MAQGDARFWVIGWAVAGESAESAANLCGWGRYKSGLHSTGLRFAFMSNTSRKLRGPRWFKVRIVNEFHVLASGPKTACTITLDNLRERMIELDELEFKAKEIT